MAYEKASAVLGSLTDEALAKHIATVSELLRDASFIAASSREGVAELTEFVQLAIAEERRRKDLAFALAHAADAAAIDYTNRGVFGRQVDIETIRPAFGSKDTPVKVTVTRAKQPSPEQLQALVDYAEAHGKNWKRELRDDWFNGRSEGLLQQVRNAFGPSWLQTFSLKDAGLLADGFPKSAIRKFNNRHED